MSRFPLSMRILFAAIVVLVVFATVCFASTTRAPGIANLTANRAPKVTSPGGHDPAQRSALESRERVDRSPSSSPANSNRTANQRVPQSQKTY